MAVWGAGGISATYKRTGLLSQEPPTRKAHPALPGLAGEKYMGEKSPEVRATLLTPVFMAMEGQEMLG